MASNNRTLESAKEHEVTGWGSLKMLASALVNQRNTHKSVGPVKSLQRSKTMQLHDLHTGFSEDR